MGLLKGGPEFLVDRGGLLDGLDGLEVTQQPGDHLGDGCYLMQACSHRHPVQGEVRLVADATDDHRERRCGSDLDGPKLRGKELPPPRLAKRLAGGLGSADFVQHASGEIGRHRGIRQRDQQTVQCCPRVLLVRVRYQPMLQLGQLGIG